MIDKRPIFICPRCGSIEYKEKGECGCGLERDKLILTNYTFEIHHSMNDEQEEQWKTMLRNRYVLCPNNTYFDKEKWNKREDAEFQMKIYWENYWKKRKQEDSLHLQSTQTVCPKCGSTSFTPVRRKWSFLTGFMTNKVDMVCNNCGCTVKKG